MIEYIILFTIGLLLSTVSVVVGSMMPVYLVLMQYFFPSLTLGNIIGADKVSGMMRGVGALYSFWNTIDWKFILTNIPAFFIGSVLGANMVSTIDNKWIVFLLVIAFFFVEFAPIFSRFFTKKIFFIFEIILGSYAGLLGSSIKPIMLSVFRIKIPDDTKIIYLKIQIQTIMFFTAFSAALTHFFHGNLIWSIVFPLAIGNILGGFLGGTMLKTMDIFSGTVQKNIMRASLLFGIVMSAWMVFL